MPVGGLDGFVVSYEGTPDNGRVIARPLSGGPKRVLSSIRKNGTTAPPGPKELAGLLPPGVPTTGWTTVSSTHKSFRGIPTITTIQGFPGRIGSNDVFGGGFDRGVGGRANWRVSEGFGESSGRRFFGEDNDRSLTACFCGTEGGDRRTKRWVWPACSKGSGGRGDQSSAPTNIDEEQ